MGMPVLGMWSRTSQQREIFTKLSHLPSSQRICSSLLTRMARVLVQSVKEAGAVLTRDGIAVLGENTVPSLHQAAPTPSSTMPVLGMWSRTSQQREIFTKLSHLPSSQRICSSLLTRMARVLVQSVKEAGAVLTRDGIAVLGESTVPSLHQTAPTPGSTMPVLGMWSKTSLQREIFTKLSHLPSIQRICSSLLTRMARVLVKSVQEAGAVLTRDGIL